MQSEQASTGGTLLYRETFDTGPGAWSTGKNQVDGSWHRNVLGHHGHPVPLLWSADGGRTGGCAAAEPPWYFDDNHGEFAWLYLLFFVNRSAEIGLANHDLRNIRIELTLRGVHFDAKESRLYFWVQGSSGQSALYNWAYTSSPIEHALRDNEWHDVTITLDNDESKWSAMGHINGGLARRIQVGQSPASARGTLNAILAGGHVNFGFLLCGIDPNDPPVGRVELDQVSFWAGGPTA
jgi:hypothetical protein